VTDDERVRVADELRRIRESVRERALMEPPAPRPAAVVEAPTPRPLPRAHADDTPSEPLPSRPDNAAVNALWEQPGRIERPGLRGRVGGWLRRALAPALEAQVAFNSRQVQLDNEILDYIDARARHIHGHYDRLLGQLGRRIEEADERHLILQEELVAHVHDLVKRIDFVLGEAERGRLSLELALRDVRARLQALEQRLGGG
jgi:hypothetical protein